MPGWVAGAQALAQLGQQFGLFGGSSAAAPVATTLGANTVSPAAVNAFYTQTASEASKPAGGMNWTMIAAVGGAIVVAVLLLRK